MGKMKIGVTLNLISVVPGAMLYFLLAFGMALAATRSAEQGAIVTLVIGLGSALIALLGALFSIFASRKVVKWRLALASPIGAIICFPILGIISLFFIIKARKEFG